MPPGVVPASAAEKKEIITGILSSAAMLRLLPPEVPHPPESAAAGTALFPAGRSQ